MASQEEAKGAGVELIMREVTIMLHKRDVAVHKLLNDRLFKARSSGKVKTDVQVTFALFQRLLLNVNLKK